MNSEHAPCTGGMKPGRRKAADSGRAKNKLSQFEVGKSNCCGREEDFLAESSKFGMDKPWDVPFEGNYGGDTPFSISPSSSVLAQLPDEPPDPVTPPRKTAHDPFRQASDRAKDRRVGAATAPSPASKCSASEELNPSYRTPESKVAHRTSNTFSPSKRSYSSPAHCKAQLDSARKKLSGMEQKKSLLTSRLSAAITDAENSAQKVARMEEQFRALKLQKSEEVSELAEMAQLVEEEGASLLSERDQEIETLRRRIIDSDEAIRSLSDFRDRAFVESAVVKKEVERMQRRVKQVRSRSNRMLLETDSQQNLLRERAANHEQRLVQERASSDGLRAMMAAMEEKHRAEERNLQAQLDNLIQKEYGPKQQEKEVLMEQRIWLLQAEVLSLKKNIAEGSTAARRALDRKEGTEREVAALRDGLLLLREQCRNELSEQERAITMGQEQLSRVVAAKEAAYCFSPIRETRQYV